MSSKNETNDTRKSPGVFQRMLELVSGVKSSEDLPSLDQPLGDERAQVLLRKQRNDMVRRKEFEELRELHRLQAAGEEGGKSAFLGTEQSRASSRQIETLNKINQLENQMASLWSKQQENVTVVSTSSNGLSALQDRTLSELAGDPAMRQPDDALQEALSLELAAGSGSGLSGDAGLASNSVSDEDQLAELVDPAIEEVAVLFASNEDAQVEQNLRAMLAKQSALRNKRVTWLILMDFYRAVGNQAAFESLAMEYTALFGESAPQWQVFDPAQVLKQQATTSGGALVYWQSPDVFDLTSAQDMQKQFNGAEETAARVMDWNGLKDFHADTACVVLNTLAKLDKPGVVLQMTGSATLLDALASQTKMLGSQGHLELWQLRLELMRLFGDAEEFDLEAMEYCLAHEVSPPSWEKPKCTSTDLDLVVEEDDDSEDSTGSGSTMSGGATTMLGAVSGYYDPNIKGPLRLRGTLKMSLAKELKALNDNYTSEAGFLRVNCERLVRIDFAAAGDLLNWVSEKSAQGKVVQLLKVNRLVAAFFMVMGISACARVLIRKD